MSSSLEILAPATITALAGSPGLSSLTQLPPDGLFVESPNPNGIITVQLSAANAGATLDAGSAGGATVSSTANMLSITGTEAQVNAALASLQINEAAGIATDTITMTASEAGVTAASTAIALDIAPATGPAFANPPSVVTLAPNRLDALPGLVIGDPEATSLNAAGLGNQETMALTLAAASGILVLPGYSALSGIAAFGLGTGTIVLDFTADQLNAVNTLLAGLEFAAPAATTGLSYSLRTIAGPLPSTVTSGNIVLDVAGTAGPPGTFAGGPETVILGTVSAAAGTTLAITAISSDLGGLFGGGAIDIAPNAALNLPYNALTLGGTSLDFGTLSATTLTETGALLIADSATFGGPILVGTNALIDFFGNLVADSAAIADNQLAISLQPGAVLTGDGVITAGNFSESGRITGPGTIFAASGETLEIDAGSIGGGAVLEAGAGGILVLGPVAPLFGIFDATPLTIDSSVTLAFNGLPDAVPITGIYGDIFAQSGGVFVINGPEAFSGTITGFVPGDRLIFPGLTDVSIYNITSTSFDLGAVDSDGSSVTYIIFATYPSGTSLFTSVDNEGDPEVGLRNTQPQIFLNGITIAEANIAATANIAQPIQGLDLLITSAPSFSLTLTLSVSHGILSDGTLTQGARLTLTAANPAAMNELLAGLTYTGTGAVDVLTLSSSTGILAGLTSTAHIDPVAAGTLNGFGGLPPTEGQIAMFSGASTAPLTEAAAPGEVVVSAAQVFADALLLNGIGGTALLIDGGAAVVFDAAASVVTQADVTIGNAAGNGTLSVITDDFTIGGAGFAGNLTVGGAGPAGDTLDLFGTLGVDGTIYLGLAEASALNLAGNLGGAATDIGVFGSVLATGTAAASLGALNDAGTISFENQAIASAAAITVEGMLALGGTVLFNDAGTLSVVAGGTVQLGPDAKLNAASATFSAGTFAGAGAFTTGALVETGGLVTLTGGTITASSQTIGATATLEGAGILNTAGAFLNQGTIIAAGGTLYLGAGIANAGIIDIAAGAALDAVQAVNGTIAFTGTAAELTVNNPGIFIALVKGMVATDVIDLVGVAPSNVHVANGQVTETNASGTVIGGFSLSAASGQPSITIVSDNAGGALITLGDEMPCFARGTRLLTPNGYRNIEALAPGDALITKGGDRRPVRWIGRRTLDFFGQGAKAAQPVVIMPHAFGNNRPHHRLRLSPLHAVFIDGVLIPALHLVNGATIKRETARAAVTYYHLELDRHDVVLAEGLPCETYFCTGNRGPLYHEIGVRTPARKEVAPRITGGPKLAAIRRRLHEAALEASFSLTYRPLLRAVSAGSMALPVITEASFRRTARFSFPHEAQRVTLISPTATPADTDPDSEDRRELAVCLARARKGGQAIRLGQGWLRRAQRDEGDWMGHCAELLLAQPARALTLSLSAIIRTWRPPRSPAVDLGASGS